MYNFSSTDLNKMGLVIIDMQYIFKNPKSQWYVPEYNLVEEKISSLLKIPFQQTIWTRFVRDAQEKGSWFDYYKRWNQCRYDSDHSFWNLTIPIEHGHSVISLPTFSKWGVELAELTKDCEVLILVGVVTDCCVLATALGAIDAGKKVILVSDACAGTNNEVHQKTIDVLQMLQPMITVTMIQELSFM